MSDLDQDKIVVDESALASENRVLREALKLAALRADGIAEEAERISRHIRAILRNTE